jgi:hypothetical protein
MVVFMCLKLVVHYDILYTMLLNPKNRKRANRAFAVVAVFIAISMVLMYALPAFQNI